MSADIATQSLNLEDILRNVVVVVAAEATEWCPVFDASRGQKTNKKVLTSKIMTKKTQKQSSPWSPPCRGEAYGHRYGKMR